MSPRSTILFGVVAIALASPSTAADCPPAVKDAVMKAHPGANVVGCKQEKEEGRVQYEVKLVAKAGEKVDLDVSPEGKILLTEEYVALDAVPPAVLQGLKAKHPDAKLQRAEKRTQADGQVTYEIAFESGKEKKSATIDTSGKLVEEEEGEEGYE